MRWFRNFSLARKLAVSFALLISLTGGLGLFALRGTSRVQSAAAELGDRWLPTTQHSLAVSNALSQFRTAEAMHVLSKSSADREGYEAEAGIHEEELGKEVKELKRILRSKDDSAAYKDFADTWSEYKAVHDTVIALSRAEHSDSAFTMVQDRTQELFDKANAALGRLTEAASDGAKHQVATSSETYTLTQRSVSGALVGCVLLGAMIAFGLARGIARPVREITAKMRQLALGDTEQTVAVTSKDEIGQLAESFNGIVAAQAELAAVARRMAEGDVSVTVTPRSEADALSRSFVDVQGALRELVSEGTRLVAAAKVGDVAARVDAERFQGAYRELVQGMNDTLAAVAARSARRTRCWSRSPRATSAPA